MPCYSSDIIKLAQEEVGYKEKQSNNQLYDKEANAGNKNWNKYADWITKNYPNFYNGRKGGSPWCDIFVDYLFLKCFGYKDALRLLCQPEKSLGAACRYSLKYYKRQGRFDKEPKIGSQIFFNDAAGVSHHTGIVENFDSTKVYTIEGNQGNQVCRKTYSRNYNRIAGYGHPEYDDSTPANNGEDDSIEERVLHINVDSSKYDTVKLTIIKE